MERPQCYGNCEQGRRACTMPGVCTAWQHKPARMHFLPRQRRIDWTELGWRVIPLACACCAFWVAWLIGSGK